MWKKLRYALMSTIVFFTTCELLLYSLDYEGTSVADLMETAGFPPNSYVHRRDRILGNWYLNDSKSNT